MRDRGTRDDDNVKGLCKAAVKQLIEHVVTSLSLNMVGQLVCVTAAACFDEKIIV